MDAHDIELRLVDPRTNRFRLYGLTVCRSLFGEPCLRIVWGRIGHRRLRERSETFASASDLNRRRDELLRRRERHGYTPTFSIMVVPSPPAGRERPALRVPAPAERPPVAEETPARAMARAIVEQHGLSLDDAAARRLVHDWERATGALMRHLERTQADHLDAVDVSTLAAFFVEALSAAPVPV